MLKIIFLLINEGISRIVSKFELKNLWNRDLYNQEVKEMQK